MIQNLPDSILFLTLFKEVMSWNGLCNGDGLSEVITHKLRVVGIDIIKNGINHAKTIISIKPRK
jgi:hypothetical protein